MPKWASVAAEQNAISIRHPSRPRPETSRRPDRTRDGGALLSPSWPAIAVRRKRLVGKDPETPATPTKGRRPSVGACLARSWFAGMHGEVPCLASFLKL